jgi:riboflavin biosynthesis pyrimidine reductase
MCDDAASTQLTELAGVGAVDEGRLAGFYGYPEGLQRCWVRGNMITSLDGGATDDGKSSGLAGPGDRELFTLMREAADVILVGAGTVRTENYSGAQFSVAQRQRRHNRGQAEVPPIAVVTRSGQLDHDAKVFTRTETPPLILTSTNAAADTRRRLGAVAEVVDASGGDQDAVDDAAVVSALADRKLFRVLTEGGPALLGSLIESGLLDELCLSIAPIVVGGAARRIVGGAGQVHSSMRRTHLLTDGAGYLYTRYVRGS